jgi:hypothetical protein
MIRLGPPIIVRSCHVLLDLEVINRWDHELSQRNLGKVGEPYCYPDSFIEILCLVKKYFHLSFRELPYRQMGIVVDHANKVPRIPHYSTISRRIKKLEIKINEKLGNDIVITLDNMGIKVANRGEWMHQKWHVSKGYLDIHISQKTLEIRSYDRSLFLDISHKRPIIFSSSSSWSPEVRKRSLFLDITSEVHSGKI